MYEWFTHFEDTLKSHRTKKGLSIREICKKVNYDPSNWSKIERGIIPAPKDIETLNKWANVLGITSKSQEFNNFINGAIISRDIQMMPGFLNETNLDWHDLHKNQFKLEIRTKKNKKIINFENNSKEFVEVVFTIDDKDTRFGRKFNNKIGGFPYPPTFKSPIAKMSNGADLFFEKSGIVKAYIYPTYAEYPDTTSNENEELPEDLIFLRGSNDPIFILKTKY